MKEDQNSYEEYKKYLETSLGISGIEAPKAPMNPYMRFFLERSSQERSKGEKNWNQLTKRLSVQWKDLPDNKKEYYEKIYNVRVRERNALLEEYHKLSGKKRPLPAYARFVKKRYAQYSKEYKNNSSVEINKMVKNDWKNLSQKQKKKLEDEYTKQKNDLELNIDNSDKIAEYEERLAKYHEQCTEDKDKVLKKYGITKESKARQRQQQREDQRTKKRAQRRLQLEQKRQEKKQQRQKLREANRKRIQEEQAARRQAKEEEKQKAKEERAKARVEEAQRRKQSASTKKKAPAAPKPVKETKSKSKPKATKAEKKATPKKVPKTKHIKKSPAKEAKKIPKEAVKASKKTKPKAKGKAKSKGKAKGGKRGKKGGR